MTVAQVAAGRIVNVLNADAKVTVVSPRDGLNPEVAYFGSVHRDGPLQIMVSTNGKGPRLANIVRRQIAANLPPNIGQAITRVGMLRKKLRQVAPDISEGPKRMAWYVQSLQS